MAFCFIDSEKANKRLRNWQSKEHICPFNMKKCIKDKCGVWNAFEERCGMVKK